MSTAQRIQSALLHHDELQTTLNETVYAKSALEDQLRLVDSLDEELRHLNREVPRLEGRRKSELMEHERYSHSKGKKFMYAATGQSSRFAARQSKEEREYHEALEAEQAAKSRQETLQQMIPETRRRADELSTVRRRHDDAQAELDGLYAAVFAASDLDLPEEARARRRAESTRHTLEQARTAHEGAQRALALLTKDVRAGLNAATTAMGDARSYSRADMAGFDMGGYADLKERESINSAQTAFMRAGVAHAEAQRADPQIPRLPGVEFASGHLTSDVLFDNLFSDHSFHQKIKASQAQVERARGALDEQIRFCDERAQRNRRQLEAAQREWADADQDLKGIRIEAFRQYGQQPPDYASQPPQYMPQQYVTPVQ